MCLVGLSPRKLHRVIRSGNGTLVHRRVVSVYLDANGRIIRGNGLMVLKGWAADWIQTSGTNTTYGGYLLSRGWMVLFGCVL